MIFRTARPEEQQQLMQFFQLSAGRFGNIEKVFNTVSTPNNTLVCEHRDKIVAMLWMFPVSASGGSGYFMQPILFSHGAWSDSPTVDEIATELIEYAIYVLSARGADFIATTTPQTGAPAEYWLKKTGFSVCTTLLRCEFTAQRLSVPKVEFAPLEPRLITSLRAGYIRGDYLTFSKNVYEAFCGYWQHKNAVVAIMQNGYGIFHGTENGIVFRELFAENVQSAVALISLVGRMQGCGNVAVYTSQNTPLFKDDLMSSPYPYGSICPLHKGFEIKDLYMNMMFD